MMYIDLIETGMVQRVRLYPKAMKTTFILLTFLFLISPIIGLAHPGNTASDGCHYCRTNCAKWGETENARHCHNSKPSSNYSNSASKTNDSDNSWMWWVGGVGLVGYFAWAGRKE